MSNHRKSLEIAKRLAKLPEDKKAVFRKALEEKGIDAWKLPIVSPSDAGDVDSKHNYPLSFAQQRLWFIEQLANDKALYNLSFGLRFEGYLNQSAVENAINEILKRHHVLRTTFFNTENGDARQRVSPYLEYALTVESIEDDSESDKRLKEIALSEAVTPFDLTRDLMFRLRLVQVNKQTTVALFTVHHIAFDFLSIPILLKEFFTFYQSFANDTQGDTQIDTSALVAELPIQYSDFSRWQREWQESRDFEKQKAYWLRQLQGATPELNLPVDLNNPGQRHLGKKGSLSLSIDLSDGIRSLAKQHAVTLYIPLFAVFTLLLSRYSGQADVSVGTSFANRSREETQNLLGFFVNLLVMRNQVAESDSFEQFLQKVNKTATEAYAHQDFPFDALVDLIDTNRESQHPLFQVLFVLNRAFDSDEVAQLPDLKISAFNQEQNIARYPLTLRVDDAGDNTPLLCEMEYDADLFSDSRIESMLGHYQHLLQQVINEPSAQLRDYALLNQDEQQALLKAHVRDSDLTDNDVDWIYLHQRFEQQAAATPDAIAVVYESESVTYGELNARANRLAHYLREQDVGAESKVGLYLDRSIHLIEALLAVLKAGAAYVPLDVHWPASRVRQILADADISVVLNARQWQLDLDAPEPSDIQSHSINIDQSAWAHCSDADPEPINSSSDAAYVIYTSGSTGVPKGVVVEHQHIINYAQAIDQRLGLEADQPSYGHISTIAADLGNTSLYGALCFGGSLHLISSERAFDPDAVAAQFAEHPVHVLKIVPGHLQGLLAAENAKDLLPKQCLILGGEACAIDLIKQVRSLAPDLRIINHYGPSETTVGVLTHEVVDADIQENRIPIGTPLANSQAYVLDQAQQLCPDGIGGTLYIGGANVARGYLNNAEQTAKRFVPNPFLPKSKKSETSEHNRLYRTGDRVVSNKNGDLLFLGRVDSQVKIRGHRVELGDIESALNRLPEIAESLVRLYKDELSDQLVAYSALRSQVEMNTGSDWQSHLRELLKSELPEYMVPQRIEILDELPRTENGKIDIKKLDALYESAVNTEPTSIRYEPANEREAILAEIWCQVLKRDQVGMEEDFFALGGDSILSLQVIARAKKNGLKITPLQLFDQPTISALAAVAKPLAVDANSTASDTNASKAPETAQLQILSKPNSSKVHTPIFCLHHGGGHTREYRALAEYIDPAIALYGIQSPALADPNYQEDDIQVVAESYVNIIRERQPKGPYRLLGWSLGGVLAMAIANELERQDQHIEFMVLIDAILSPPEIVGRYGPDTFIENFLAVFGAQAAQKYHGLEADLRKQLEDQLATMDEQEALGHTCDWIANLGILDETQIDRIYVNLRYRTAVQARRLIDSYMPKKVSANLYIWWAEQSFNNNHFPTDWRVFGDKLISEEIHPGGHYDMIQDADLHQSVAETLNSICCANAGVNTHTHTNQIEKPTT